MRRDRVTSLKPETCTIWDTTLATTCLPSQLIKWSNARHRFAVGTSSANVSITLKRDSVAPEARRRNPIFDEA